MITKSGSRACLAPVIAQSPASAAGMRMFVTRSAHSARSSDRSKLAQFERATTGMERHLQRLPRLLASVQDRAA